jgi:hypothetical protein
MQRNSKTYGVTDFTKQVKYRLNISLILLCACALKRYGAQARSPRLRESAFSVKN